MTREEQIERVREILFLDTYPYPYLSRWSLSERIVDAVAQPVESQRLSGEHVGPLGDYIAVNLREALKVIPDNGDWHGAVRYACEQALKGSTAYRPNHTAEQLRDRIVQDALAEPIEVTDEMVKAFMAEMYGKHWAQHLPKPAADCQRESVRAALHAAWEAGTTFAVSDGRAASDD